MNYFLRMLSTIGWIWGVLFGVFLVIVMMMKKRWRSRGLSDSK
jgi:hypothetical protein